jgi:YD repeat-containing protein
LPDTAYGPETYGYDANNNLTSKTGRKGQTISYVSDALNRLTKKQYPIPKVVSSNLTPATIS